MQLHRTHLLDPPQMNGNRDENEQNPGDQYGITDVLDKMCDYDLRKWSCQGEPCEQRDAYDCYQWIEPQKPLTNTNWILIDPSHPRIEDICSHEHQEAAHKQRHRQSIEPEIDLC